MTETYTRTFTLDRKAGKDNIFPAVATTEAPVLRGNYYEVLAMDRIDLSRAPLPFIESHDSGQVNIGVAENVHTDGDKLRCNVRLGNSARAKELAEDIKGGIVTGLSIGYRVDDPIEDGEIDGTPVYRFAATPFELSAVSVPADIDAGFYKSSKGNTMETEKLSRSERTRENHAMDDEQNRCAIIREAAEQFGVNDLGQTAIADGWSVQRFNAKAVLVSGERRNNSTRVESAPAHEGTRSHNPSHYAGMPCDNDAYGRAMQEYSLSRLLRHMIDPQKHDAGLEREIGQDVERVSGRGVTRGGVMVPWEALGPVQGDVNHQTRDVTVGGTGSNLVATNLMAGSFIDILRARSMVMQLGPTVLPGLVGDVAVPVKSTTGTGYWFAADGSDAITESDQAYTQRTLTPKFLGALTDVSYKALMQSSPSLEALTRQDFIDLAAVTLDWAAIQGTGASNQPTGVVSTSGINAVEYTNGGDPTLANLIQMETEIATDNADRGPLRYLAHPALSGTMKGTDVGTDTGQFLWSNGQNAQGMVNGYSAYSSSNVPTGTAILADWSQLLIGMWSGVEIAVDNGGSNFAYGLTTFRMIATIDLAVRHPEAFCTLTEAAP